MPISRSGLGKIYKSHNNLVLKCHEYKARVSLSGLAAIALKSYPPTLIVHTHSGICIMWSESGVQIHHTDVNWERVRERWETY